MHLVRRDVPGTTEARLDHLEFPAPSCTCTCTILFTAIAADWCFYTITIIKLKHSSPYPLFLLPASIFLSSTLAKDVAVTSHSQQHTQKIAAMDGVDMPPLGGDQNRGPVVIAVLSLFFGLSTIIVFLRVVTRICITRNFGWDDATMALTQVRSVPTSTEKC
jgi:hypothetical protein